jgi:hypothetical protein
MLEAIRWNNCSSAFLVMCRVKIDDPSDHFLIGRAPRLRLSLKEIQT